MGGFVTPDLNTFKSLAAKGNIVSVYTELLADMETPLAVYSRIADGQYSFLLESVEGGENVGRYSFIGAKPRMVFSSKGKTVSVEERGASKTYDVADSPVEELRRIMRQFTTVPVPALPRFSGGAVGYFSYDAIQFFEDLPQRNDDDLELPELYFVLTDTLVAFDHVRHRVLVIANAFCDGQPLDTVYDEACGRIEAIVQTLSLPLPFQPLQPIDSRALAMADVKQPPSNYSVVEYRDIVERCKEYVRAGDIIQVVPSQRFVYKTDATPLAVYRALRCVNPSPYMLLLEFKGMALVGASPEVMVRVENGEVEMRPIAGTRRRGLTHEEDLAFERELLADEKERAEHVMLVDLGRNDLGRVCEIGSVKVTDLMVIERYSHVMHIVSNVQGKLLPGKDAFDVLAATFPAGTVSGAPKIRAMQIIEEMEKCRRGPYAGTVCYLGYDGALDSCITIRTAVMKDGAAYVQAGGGIVADSVHELEYKETVNKARAMIKAIHLAGTLGERKGSGTESQGLHVRNSGKKPVLRAQKAKTPRRKKK